ncbi:MAG: LolA family protein [Candidatus Poribacteria bacterium]
MPDTISLNFERKIVKEDSTEIVKGISYYKSPQKLYIEVQHPLKQIMAIENNVLTIYYPIEKKAFRIKSKGPIQMPFIQSILSAMKEDYGLSDVGYTLTKSEMRGKILYTYWEPPKKYKKQMGKFIIGVENGLLSCSEALDPKGKTVIKSFYKKHIEINGKYFPLEVQSEITDGSIQIKEYIIYSNVKINIPLPQEVINFSIPNSVPVKEIEW